MRKVPHAAVTDVFDAGAAQQVRVDAALGRSRERRRPRPVACLLSLGVLPMVCSQSAVVQRVVALWRIRHPMCPPSDIRVNPVASDCIPLQDDANAGIFLQMLLSR
jgi:hypothetical protein